MDRAKKINFTRTNQGLTVCEVRRRLKQLISEEREQQHFAISLTGTGTFYLLDDLKVKYENTPAHLKFIRGNTKTLMYPMRDESVYEDMDYNK